MAMNLSSPVSASSSSAKDPIASKGSGKLIASGKSDAKERRNSKLDAASTSQVRLQDAYLGVLMDGVAGKPAATDERNYGNFPNLNHGAIMRKKLQGNLLHPEIQKFQGIQKLKTRNGHIIYICLQLLYFTWKKTVRS